MRLLPLVMLTLIFTASAGEIYGSVYRWDTLEKVDAIVEIFDGSKQRMVAENGSYRFILPDGNYTIVARWGDFYTEENVTVAGSVRYDLVLFPTFEEIELPPPPPLIEEEPPYYIVTATACAAVLLVLYYLKRREATENSELPEDLSEVLEVIRRAGGRITQKELRKKLGYSEAKMSLILADLERRGLVERVKKGRGKIIFLK
ncbi:MAG: MarR family transcriptional regulator [Archaeoglobaceae archaeon]